MPNPLLKFCPHLSTILCASVTAPTRAPIGAEFCDAFDFGGSPDPNSPNILEVASENPELSVIVSLIELTDLDPVFDCPGTFVTR